MILQRTCILKSINKPKVQWDLSMCCLWSKSLEICLIYVFCWLCWAYLMTRLSYYYVAAIFFCLFSFFFIFIAIVFVVLLLLLLISLLLIYFSYHFLLFLFSFFLCHLAFFDIFLLFYFDLFFGSTVSSEKIVSLLMYMQLYSFKY